MKDEDFEKYFERLFPLFNRNSLGKPSAKEEIREILEEVEKKGHDSNIHYQLLKVLDKTKGEPDGSL